MYQFSRFCPPKCCKAIFLIYPLESKGYCRIKVCEVEAKRLTRCRDVLFHDNKFHTISVHLKKSPTAYSSTKTL